jgi:hypothetical protein
MSGVTFIYVVHVGHSTLADHGWRPNAPGGPTLMFLSVDGGCSWVSSSGISYGSHRRHFLTLMVGALGSLAQASHRGPAIDIS